MKQFHLEQADPKGGYAEFYEAMAAHLNRLREESSPEDPPTPVKEVRHRLQNMPDFIEPKLWLVKASPVGPIIASGGGFILHTGQNEHICQVDIRVEPAYRRQGIARTLLAKATAFAAESGRRLLLFNTHGTVPAGEAVMNHIGAQKALESSVNQLDLDEVNREMVANWIKRGQEKAIGIELGLWTGPYPGEQLERVVELMKVMDQQPLDDLDVEDMGFTAEHIRSLEKATFAEGVERWTFYARDLATGQMAGFTELYWRPTNPNVLEQGNTGVFPDYRGRGIGRWLKAAMIAKVFAERPEARFIRTGNANSNAPMLKINYELGFRQLKANTTWQLPVAKAQSYLKLARAVQT